MSNTAMSPNHREVISGQSTVTGKAEYLKSTGGLLNVLTSGSGQPGLVPFAYDYIAYTNTSSTVDTYTYKSGGSGGVTVATVTITYTDTTKAQISTVART